MKCYRFAQNKTNYGTTNRILRVKSGSNGEQNPSTRKRVKTM